VNKEAELKKSIPGVNQNTDNRADITSPPEPDSKVGTASDADGAPADPLSGEVARLRGEIRALHLQLSEQDSMNTLVGNSVQIENVREKIRLIAGTGAPVLVTGETGVGKELVAREIHRLSARSDRIFIKINCALVPATVLETELFGREKRTGAGAFSVEPGRLVAADRGTILLDEIDEMDPYIQSMLLQLIEQGSFTRAGGRRPVDVDVRVIAATSRNLKDEVRRGRFREDLFYRLNVVPLEVPPLRDRREDIPLLVAHFIRLFAEQNGSEPVSLAQSAADKLNNAYWNRNVRQLRNVIERAAVLGSGRMLEAGDLQLDNERAEQLSRVDKAFRFGTIRDMEKLMILNRLRDNGNNRTHSAETLDISVRTLRNKLNEYNVPNKYARKSVEEPSPLSG
jgi:DNA-binding NtrC family response regulator